MGADPATSVVGADNETHDTAGLFVMDGSCFPTASGVNPMLSIGRSYQGRWALARAAAADVRRMTCLRSLPVSAAPDCPLLPRG